MLLSTFQITSLDPMDEYSFPDYGPNDPEYDWGYAEDGTPVPFPCPVDGVPYGACTSPDYNGAINYMAVP